MSTPAEWYEREMAKLEMLTENGLEPADYFKAGEGSIWLLSMMDGLRALQAYCLAAGGTMVRLVNGESRD